MSFEMCQWKIWFCSLCLQTYGRRSINFRTNRVWRFHRNWINQRWRWWWYWSNSAIRCPNNFLANSWSKWSNWIWRNSHMWLCFAYAMWNHCLNWRGPKSSKQRHMSVGVWGSNDSLILFIRYKSRIQLWKSIAKVQGLKLVQVQSALPCVQDSFTFLSVIG